ncbi:hypothetical protein IFM89_001209 [Coptis chinensis]|uniref:Uncharacterized protein n=1 Tax=Coptis chinensis TaxID=261450 RepID=A0A835LQ97_9MAGN|nr:hypothetical protein IFM89_001209 [Coptis chinensis]
MRLLLSLSMFVSLLWMIWLIEVRAQSPPGTSGVAGRSLDVLLQDYAYRAFDRPRVKTGDVYNGTVPSNLTGIRISAMRLRSGSFYSRGVRYWEFEIPNAVVVRPYVQRLVLVYQNLGNLSLSYYPLSGYTYLTPVVGVLAYDAINLSAVNLPELNLSARGRPILINFSLVESVPDGLSAQCVWIDFNGLPQFTQPVSSNVCSTLNQGHFAIVAEQTALSPAPVSPSPTGEVPNVPTGGTRNEGNKSKVWIIVGSVVGGFVLLVLLGFLSFWVQRYKSRKKMHQMEKAAEVGEALHMASVGNTRAPVAMGTRTQPVLENEYVP